MLMHFFGCGVRHLQHAFELSFHGFDTTVICSENFFIPNTLPCYNRLSPCSQRHCIKHVCSD